LDTRHRKIDICNIEHKTEKDRYGQHWTQDTERQTRLSMGRRHRRIDKCNIGHKTHKDRHG
jgi:hypothetical protein